MRKNLRKKEIAFMAISMILILMMISVFPLGNKRVFAEKREDSDLIGQNDRIGIEMIVPETDYYFDGTRIYDHGPEIGENVDFENAILKGITCISINETNEIFDSKVLYENSEYQFIRERINRIINGDEFEIQTVDAVKQGLFSIGNVGMNENTILRIDDNETQNEDGSETGLCDDESAEDNDNEDEEASEDEPVNEDEDTYDEEDFDDNEDDDSDDEDNDDDDDSGKEDNEDDSDYGDDSDDEDNDDDSDDEDNDENEEDEDDEDDSDEDDNDEDEDSDDDSDGDDDEDDTDDDDDDSKDEEKEFIDYLKSISKGKKEFEKECFSDEGLNKILIVVEYLEFDASDDDKSLKDRVGEETEFAFEIKFIVDAQDPIISVEFTDSNAGYYCDHDRTANVKISDMYLDKESVVISVDGNEIGIEDENDISESGTVEKSIAFSGDGKHSGKITAKDKAGHEVFVTIGEFCIDTKAPEIDVLIEDEDQRFTNKERKAYVKINDDNPDGESEFVYIFKEGEDSLKIDAKDLAGNESSYQSDKYVQDYTAPELTVEGFENGDIFNGVISFNVSFSDEWPDKTDSYVELFEKGNNEPVKYEFEKEDDRLIVNIQDENGLNDDHYILKCHSEDKAGNKNEFIHEFTINRRGSVFELSEELRNSMGKSVETVSNIGISEKNISKINPNLVRVIFTHDAKVLDLVNGNDYIIRESCTEKGYEYQYEFSDGLFKKEGVYTIALSDVDEAGNVNDTRLNEGTDEIRFAIKKNKKEDDPKEIIEDKNEMVTLISEDLENSFVYTETDKEIEEKHEVTGQNEVEQIVQNDKATDSEKEIKTGSLPEKIEAEERKFHIRSITWIKIGLAITIIILTVILIINKRKKKK